jgi:hypothetical protein
VWIHQPVQRHITMSLKLMLLLLNSAAMAVDNGVGLTPPLGWRTFNAFWGIIDQVKMETTMDAMVNRSRKVDGKPTSLLDLGYNRVGVDGGWNYCFPENKTFHWADGTPIWNSNFPKPQDMVNKAKKLGLSPGWYMVSTEPLASRSHVFVFLC